MLDTTITWWRGRRSAHTPPASRKTTCGTERAARTKPEVGLRAGHVEHRECERDRGERVADHRDGAAEEEQTELPLGERRQPAGHAV
jgi:hypothetical protein